VANEGALVLYGRGGSLGNFKFFADDLLVTELIGYKPGDVTIKNVERRDDFFSALDSHPVKLKELHVFSHSIGGGLFLGYGDPVLGNARSMLADSARGGRAFYDSVLNAEKGTLFADDLVRSPYAGYAARMRSLFAPGGKIKIWGCNSGIANWEYSDEDAAGNPVYDLNAPALYYYWRALNERYMPKPSIAQAFADYLRVSTFGATSGSSTQIKQKGKWNKVPLDGKIAVAGKRRFVGERDVLRLAPDVGTYREYKP
jgi:hypothetical protein